MARRIARISIVCATAAVGFAFACVDLFHGTDFKTLCTEKPTDPQCGGAIDSGASDAPAEAAKPDIDFCKLTSAEAKDRAIRACAYLGACGGSIEPNAFADCVSRGQLVMDCNANPTLRPVGAFEKLWKCLATVSSCKDVAACVFTGPEQACGDVASSKFIQCTSPSVAGGNVRLECSAPGGAPNTRFDSCLVAGQRCTNDDAGSSATCTGVKGTASCSTSSCDGTHAVGCETYDRGYDCATVGGGACVEDALGPACMPGAGAGPCTDGGGATTVAICDSAGVARACVGGKEVAVDCRKLGLGCDETLTPPSYDPAARCVGTAFPPCSEKNDNCVDGNLRGCIKGEAYTAQCTALGLGKCGLVANRASCTKSP